MSLAAVSAFITFLSRPGGWPGRDNLRRAAEGLDWLNKPVKTAVLTLLVMFSLINVVADRNQVPLGKTQHLAHLSDKQPAYDLMQAAAADPGIGDGPILQFQLQQSRYFFPGKVYGDWMGLYRWHGYGHARRGERWKIDDARTLYRKVTDQGFKAVAMRIRPDAQFQPQELSSYASHFDILLENKFGVLMAPKPAAED